MSSIWFSIVRFTRLVRHDTGHGIAISYEHSVQFPAAITRRSTSEVGWLEIVAVVVTVIDWRRRDSSVEVATSRRYSLRSAPAVGQTGHRSALADLEH